MISINLKKLTFCLIIILTFCFYYSGLYLYFLTIKFEKYKHWGPDINFEKILENAKSEKIVYKKEHFLEKTRNLSTNQIRLENPTEFRPYVRPVTTFRYKFLEESPQKCQEKSIKLLIIVKSSIENFERRKIIRKTWGYEDRFADVKIKTVFLLGFDFKNFPIQKKIQRESEINQDIIQGEFQETYFNNTLKTLMGLTWTYENCKNAKFFLFVDDDFYVSIRNVLRILKNPLHYPSYITDGSTESSQNISKVLDNLYLGYVLKSVAPIRLYFSKWYVSLEEYPYDKWPPYVTAGAYILSRSSLEKLFYAGMYTKLFRFDDIYVAMAAKKAGLKPIHSREFHLHKKSYSVDGYKWVVATHGFGNPVLLQWVWDEQRSAGNA